MVQLDHQLSELGVRRERNRDGPKQFEEHASMHSRESRVFKYSQKNTGTHVNPEIHDFTSFRSTELLVYCPHLFHLTLALYFLARANAGKLDYRIQTCYLAKGIVERAQCRGVVGPTVDAQQPIGRPADAHELAGHTRKVRSD